MNYDSMILSPVLASVLINTIKLISINTLGMPSLHSNTIKPIATFDEVVKPAYILITSRNNILVFYNLQTGNLIKDINSKIPGGTNHNGSITFYFSIQLLSLKHSILSFCFPPSRRSSFWSLL